jgi:hypothetical protein
MRRIAANIVKLSELSGRRVEVFSDAGHIPNANHKVV